MTEPKKQHLYRVEFSHTFPPSVVYVLAQTRQGAITGAAARYVTAARAEPLELLQNGVTMDQVIHAGTGHAAQEPLPLVDPTNDADEPGTEPTAAEQLEEP